MISIIISLLVGWILSLFGFESLVIGGMLQVFGVSITSTGYYFLFAIFGALKSIGFSFGNKGEFIRLKYKELKEKHSNKE